MLSKVRDGDYRPTNNVENKNLAINSNEAHLKYAYYRRQNRNALLREKNIMPDNLKNVLITLPVRSFLYLLISDYVEIHADFYFIFRSFGPLILK